MAKFSEEPPTLVEYKEEEEVRVIISSSTSHVREACSVFRISFPIAVTALLFYSRSVVSMVFLGSLGDLALAGGSLAVAFANITGYSVLSGLSLGMEPLCSQAHGARQSRLLSLTLYRSVLFLLCSSLPISLVWINMSSILCNFLGGQEDLQEITSLSQTYLLYSLPDLLSFSFIHPIRIYLRSQGITTPLTVTASLASLLHVPFNFLFVTKFRLGPAGVAAAGAASNLSLLLFLSLYYLLILSDDDDNELSLSSDDDDDYDTTPPRTMLRRWRRECLRGWGPLARLAFPSCISVCLEWWWYELMILLCGLLPDPKPAIASMGVLIQATALIYVFPSSLGFGVSARVGNELGANRPSRAKASATVSIFFAGLMGFVAMGSAVLARDRWGRMFTADVKILTLTAAALPILGLCELGNCPQTVGCGVLRGSARPAHAARVNLGAFYLVGMPVGVGLAFGLGFGFCGLWMGLLSAQLCCAGLMLYVVMTTDWQAQAKRAQLLTSTDFSSKDEEGNNSDVEKGTAVQQEETKKKKKKKKRNRSVVEVKKEMLKEPLIIG